MIKYEINKKTNLIISDNVINKINKYRQLENMYEAGGILLGKVKLDYSEYEIVDISEPCSKDKRSKYGFIRNKENAQKIINEAFEKSNGVIQYMGEWHTHPELNPIPSNTDKKLLDECFKNKNIPRKIFMLILGNKGELYVGFKDEYLYEMKEIKEIGE